LDYESVMSVIKSDSLRNSMNARRTPATAEANSPDPVNWGGAVTVSLFETFAELLSVRSEWDAFVEKSGSDIYFTFDWLETWWKYYGAGRRLRCFLLRADGQPIAALPFCIQDVHMGPISLAVAKFVGADSTIPVFTPAVEPTRESEIWSIVLRWLLVKEHLDAVCLSPLSGASSASDAVQQLAKRENHFHIVRDDSFTPHTLFFLPASVEEYSSMLSSHTRRVNRRYFRKLNEAANIIFRTVRGEEAVERFDAFAKLHQLQWEASGRQGHFRDWPSGLAFNTEIVARLAKNDQVRLHEIFGDGELLSAQYSLVLGDRCYWRLPARRADAQHPGLGRLALVKMMEALIEEGVKLSEAGPAHYDYKIEHAGKELFLRRLLITRASLTARVETKLLLLWSDLIDLFYYRIWFKRVRPYFRKTGPLSRVWIMTRL
jgi:CelD/BcsL family acetyltransferase involved in cellulose biosynthesis